MSTAPYVRWQDAETWLGCFEQFPGFTTQGESMTDLEENLRDLHPLENGMPDEGVPRGAGERHHNAVRKVSGRQIARLKACSTM